MANLSNTPTSRRAFLTTSGAAAAATAAAVVPVYAANTLAADPDAALIELVERLEQADAAWKVAQAEELRLYDKAAALKPSRPEALRCTKEDRLFGLHCLEVVTKEPAEFYDHAHVRLLRRAHSLDQTTWTPVHFGTSGISILINDTVLEEPTGRGPYLTKTDRFPEHMLPRAAEIVSAHDEWSAECAKIDAAVGLTAAEDRREQAGDLYEELCEAMINAGPATTLAGHRARARAILSCHNGEFGDFGECTDTRLATAIVRDLLAPAFHQS